MNLPKIVIDIAKHLKSSGYKAILVGGAVRDFYLKKSVKDFDIEVYNIDSLETLASKLMAFGSVDLVGKSFGVVKLKVDNYEYDFSIPRREIKVSKGHRGFNVKVDGALDFKEASRRRDFTINAMGWDIIGQKLLDPFGGLYDLKNKILRIVDKNSFIEDPLRVYRAVQFGARFEFTLSRDTLMLCSKLANNGSLKELSKERVWEEFKKFLLKADKPSIGFELMQKVGVLKYFFELERLIGVEQEPRYHPEGDVWIHTLMVVNEMAKLREDSEELNIKLMLSALCHDFGKPETTKKIDGKIRAIGHEEVGIEITKNFLKRLTDQKDLIKNVATLVKYHLRPIQLYKSGAKSSAIKRLSTKVNLQELEKLARADYFGRGDIKSDRFEAGEWLLTRAKELNVLNSAPKKLLEGKDLINLGLEPSKKFGKILKEAYQAQLNGEFSSKKDAICWIANKIKI